MPSSSTLDVDYAIRGLLMRASEAATGTTDTIKLIGMAAGLAAMHDRDHAEASATKSAATDLLNWLKAGASPTRKHYAHSCCLSLHAAAQANQRHDHADAYLALADLISRT